MSIKIGWEKCALLKSARPRWLWDLSLNPEFAVAIYYGLQILAATLAYCLTPVLLTGAQRETIGTFVPLLFHPPDETKPWLSSAKLPVARVVVCDTILFLNIIMIMPASHRQNALRQRRKA